MLHNHSGSKCLAPDPVSQTLPRSPAEKFDNKKLIITNYKFMTNIKGCELGSGVRLMQKQMERRMWRSKPTNTEGHLLTSLTVTTSLRPFNFWAHSTKFFNELFHFEGGQKYSVLHTYIHTSSWWAPSLALAQILLLLLLHQHFLYNTTGCSTHKIKNFLNLKL